MQNFEKWKQQLQELDTTKNNKKTFNRVLKTYLTSTAADDTRHRADVIFLFHHLKKLLK